MTDWKIIVLVLGVMAFFFLGLRSYLWEEHFKKYPKDRKKNKETRERLKKEIIKIVKEKFKYLLGR